MKGVMKCCGLMWMENEFDWVIVGSEGLYDIMPAGRNEFVAGNVYSGDSDCLGFAVMPKLN